jgi:hypothetical protein
MLFYEWVWMPHRFHPITLGEQHKEKLVQNIHDVQSIACIFFSSKRSKYKRDIHETIHIMCQKELGLLLQPSNIQQCCNKTLNPWCSYTMWAAHQLRMILCTIGSQLPHWLSWGYFFDPDTNSFTEFCADNIAFLICHCKFVSKRIPMFNMYADELNGNTIKYKENNFLSAIKR